MNKNSLLIALLGVAVTFGLGIIAIHFSGSSYGFIIFLIIMAIIIAGGFIAVPMFYKKNVEDRDKSKELNQFLMSDPKMRDIMMEEKKKKLEETNKQNSN